MAEFSQGPGDPFAGIAPLQTARIRAAIAEGRKIEAIRLYREATRASLFDAKTVIDREMGDTPMRPIAAGTIIRGLALLAVVVVLIAIVVFFNHFAAKVP